MRVTYLGASDPLCLIHNKEYEVIAIEFNGEMYRIVDETGEDYLYGVSEFEIVEEKE